MANTPNHNFYRWYKPFPVMAGFWHCFSHVNRFWSGNNWIFNYLFSKVASKYGTLIGLWSLPISCPAATWPRPSSAPPCARATAGSRSCCADPRWRSAGRGVPGRRTTDRCHRPGPGCGRRAGDRPGIYQQKMVVNEGWNGLEWSFIYVLMVFNGDLRLIKITYPPVR